MGIRTVIVLSILAMAFAVVVLFIWLGQRQQQKKLRATARLNRERQQQTRLSKNEPAIMQMNNKRVIIDPLVSDLDEQEESLTADESTKDKQGFEHISTSSVYQAESRNASQKSQYLPTEDYVSPARIVSSSTQTTAPRSSYSPPKTGAFNTRPFAVPTPADTTQNSPPQTEPVVRPQIQTQTYAKYKASTQAQMSSQSQASQQTPSSALTGTTTQNQQLTDSLDVSSHSRASYHSNTFRGAYSQAQAASQTPSTAFSGSPLQSQAVSQAQTPAFRSSLSQPQASSQNQSAIYNGTPSEPQSQQAQTSIESAPKKESAPLPGYLTLSLMAEKGKPFGGYELFQAILGSGMRHGERQIFHYYDMEQPNRILFSLASIAKPGTFCIETIGAFSTPGLIFIFEIERTSRLLNAFELLLQTARHLADELEGNLLDDQRQPLTTERIQTLRQQLCEITPVTDFDDD